MHYIIDAPLQIPVSVISTNNGVAYSPHTLVTCKTYVNTVTHILLVFVRTCDSYFWKNMRRTYVQITKHLWKFLKYSISIDAEKQILECCAVVSAAVLI